MVIIAFFQQPSCSCSTRKFLSGTRLQSTSSALLPMHVCCIERAEKREEKRRKEDGEFWRACVFSAPLQVFEKTKLRKYELSSLLFSVPPFSLTFFSSLHSRPESVSGPLQISLQTNKPNQLDQEVKRFSVSREEHWEEVFKNIAAKEDVSAISEAFANLVKIWWRQQKHHEFLGFVIVWLFPEPLRVEGAGAEAEVDALIS